MPSLLLYALGSTVVARNFGGPKILRIYIAVKRPSADNNIISAN